MYEKCKVQGQRKCSFCGKEFNIYHKSRMQKEDVFCSVECANLFKKSEGLNCKCVVCGKPMHKKRCELTNMKHPPTCSYECMGKLRSKIYRGKANPNFGNIGESNPIYKGNTITHCKYLWEYAPNHPFSVGGVGHRVRQHRLVAEQYLLNEENSVEIDGVRYLKPEYDVHHIDFNKFNNEPSNLMVLSRSEHQKLHQELKRERRRQNEL